MSESAVENRKRPEFIYPRIYVALPEVGGADINLSADDSPVETRLAADLLILYAYDLDAYFQIISFSELKELGMTKDELHKLAVHNLHALELRIESLNNGRTAMLTAGGNFEAALLLIPDLWNQIAPGVQGEIVACVPARDIIYFTGDADPDNLSDMRALTSRMLEIADKPLSRCFLKRTSDGWAPYHGHGA